MKPARRGACRRRPDLSRRRLSLEAIINRAAVPILNLFQNQPPEAVVALAPSMVRAMLWAVLEMQAESRRGADDRNLEQSKGACDDTRAVTTSTG